MTTETKIRYEVELDYPDAYVEFIDRPDLTDDQILARAIEELTYKTYLFDVKKKELKEI